MIVKLQRKTTRYSDLTYGQYYAVIGIEADDFRLLNDRGQPYLYPSQLFEIVDPSEPEDWITEFGEDGERYAYPPRLYACGFFEDFFDAKKEAVVTFWQVVNQRLGTAKVSASSSS
ncbi:MAG: hypothetical protein ETSY2_35515 [Candidatus Entotheonella gemina]|uniref:Uncharacterized protein n=1 Tax=Candidatus Entotheonella gemina TaxID=1429439 RepID=W4LWI7_9BACT|nr:MAG: hypothetical protein ETSY2_35515 [Candidatus Entotheonella gemina]